VRLRVLASVIAFCVGFGITLHAVASELYYKGGYGEILSWQGEYVGLAFVLIGFLILLLSK